MVAVVTSLRLINSHGGVAVAPTIIRVQAIDAAELPGETEQVDGVGILLVDPFCHHSLVGAFVDDAAFFP